jgi:hypothetical protein
MQHDTCYYFCGLVVSGFARVVSVLERVVSVVVELERVVSELIVVLLLVAELSAVVAVVSPGVLQKENAKPIVNKMIAFFIIINFLTGIQNLYQQA